MFVSQGALQKTALKNLLINFIILHNWKNLFKRCIFANLLVMECYVQVLRKEIIIAPFLDPQNNYFEKVLLQAFINNSN